MTARSLSGLFGFLLLLLAGVSAPASADTAADSKTVGGVVIYMGLLPAEMIRGPTASMHGGAPRPSGEYHVTIALFSTTDGSRIENADVGARVFEVGLASERKKLEPMQIAGTVTYGNYFTMRGTGPFRIELTIHVPGQPRDIEAEFEHRHQ